MRPHLSLIAGERRDTLDPDYWRHPVHAGRTLARQTLAQIDAAQIDAGAPYMVRLSASVIVAQVKANNNQLTPAVKDAFEVLGAWFSTPAPNDDCPPKGIVRPDGGAA